MALSWAQTCLHCCSGTSETVKNWISSHAEEVRILSGTMASPGPVEVINLTKALFTLEICTSLIYLICLDNVNVKVFEQRGNVLE